MKHEFVKVLCIGVYQTRNEHGDIIGEDVLNPTPVACFNSNDFDLFVSQCKIDIAAKNPNREQRRARK